MIPLSPRLLCCASMIKGDFVCDIGTDHAYLPAYLVKSGKVRQALATDIRKGPLEMAKQTLKKHGISQEVRLILSDGFEHVPPKGITDAVIAGMGGETIRDILADKSAAWLKNGVNLVLQPMTKSEVLRRWLAENGFCMTKETAVKDNHIYTVIQANYTGAPQTLTDAEAYCGKLNRAELLTKIYIADIQKHLHTKAHGLDDAGKPEDAAAVRQLIHDINIWMNPSLEEQYDRSGYL